MKVQDKCFAIWDFLNAKKRYAFTQKEIRKGLQKDGELEPALREMKAKDILCALGVLKHNGLVRRIERREGVYWQGQGNWLKLLQKKHGGYHT